MIEALRRTWTGIPALSRQLLGVEFLSNAGTGLVLPFLAIYVSRVRGHGPDTGSIAVAAFAGGCIVANIGAGRLVDRYGARIVLQAGWVLAAAAEAGLIAASTTATLLLIAAAIGGGVGAAYPALRALLGKLTPPAQRSLVFGAQHGLLNIGLSVGTLTAALLIGSATVSRFQLLYALDAASFVLAAGFLTILRPNRQIEPDKADECAQVEQQVVAEMTQEGSYWKVLADPAFRRVCVVQGLLVVFGYAQYHAALPIFLSRPGALVSRDVALVFAANTLTVACAAVPVAVLTRSIQRSRMLAAGALCFALCWVLLATSAPLGHALGGVVLAVTAVAIMGLGETLLSPSLGPLANDLAPPELRGRYNSVDALVLSVGTVTGPALTAFLLDNSSSPLLLFAVLGFGCLAAAIVSTRPAFRMIGAERFD